MGRTLKFALYVIGLLLVIPASLHLIPFKDLGFQGFDGPFAWRRFGWTYVSDFMVNLVVGTFCIFAAHKSEQISLDIPNDKSFLRLAIFISGATLAIFAIGLIWAIIYDSNWAGGFSKEMLLPTFGILSGAFTKLGIGLLALFIAKKIGVKHD